jgi:hypothetical protein
MTIIVGTDTYLSVADADAYWLARSNTTWSDADNAVKEKALIEATQYLDGAFSYIGTQITTNVLAWPRYEAFITKGNFAGVTYDSSTIPPQITNACAEIALHALSARLVEVKERDGAVKREKVDVIEVEYLDRAPSSKTYKFATMILSPLLNSGGRMKGLVRS